MYLWCGTSAYTAFNQVKLTFAEVEADEWTDGLRFLDLPACLLGV